MRSQAKRISFVQGNVWVASGDHWGTNRMAMAVLSLQTKYSCTPMRAGLPVVCCWDDANQVLSARLKFQVCVSVPVALWLSLDCVPTIGKRHR